MSISLPIIRSLFILNFVDQSFRRCILSYLIYQCISLSVVVIVLSTVIARAAGFMTVFINGIPQEVPRGPFDLGEIFGQDVMLVHSSGELIPLTNHGILLQDLQAGESYFLVRSLSLPLSLSLRQTHNRAI